MHSRTRFFSALVFAAATRTTCVLGDTVSLVPNDAHNDYFSSIQDKTLNGSSTVPVTMLPMTGTDTAMSTDSTSTVYNLQGSDLNFQFTDMATDDNAQNQGTIYFTPNQDTTYSLSGSFSGEAYDNFGVNLTEVFVQGNNTYYTPLFSSSFVIGSLADPTDPGLYSESGSLTGSLMSGGTYFISYQTGPQSPSAGGFVDLAIGTVPEPVSGISSFCALLGYGCTLRQRRRAQPSA